MNEDRLIAALLGATLQTIALSAVVALTLRGLRHTSASARCAVWTGALIIAVALPFVDYARIQSVSEPALGSSSVQAAAQTFAPAKALNTMPAPALIKRASVPETSPLTVDSVRFTLAGLIKRVAHILFYVWIAGATIFAIRLMYQMACLFNAKRAIEPVEPVAFFRSSRLRRSATLGLSDRVAVPCLLGFIRPVIALPRALASELSDEDIQRIVLHEAAHLERCDDWFNLLEQVALVFFFFNPALHFIARSIGTEREIACDDRVVARSHSRITYAACLSELARRCAGRSALTVPGFFTNRRQILVRIEQLLDRRHNGSPQVGRKALAAIGMMMVIGLLLSQLGIPVIAAGICPDRLARMASLPALERFQQSAWTPGLVPALHAPGPLAKTRANTALRAPSPAAPAASVQPDVVPAPPSASIRPHAAVPAAAAAPAALPAAAPAALPAAAQQAYAYAFATSAAARSVNAVAATAPVARQDASYSDGPSLAGYSGLSVDQIIELHDHGVDSRFIERMKSAGYGSLKPEDLIRLRDHSVTAAFAQSMNAMAARQLDVESLVRLRDHGVTTLYADSLAAYGLRGIAIDQLLELRDHGISPEYLNSLAQAGYAKIPADQAILLHDHGVTASYIQHIRKDLNPAKLTIEELIRLRDSGI